MKLKFILAGLVIVAVVAGLIFAYRQMSRERAADEQADQPVSSPSRVETGPSGQSCISLDLKTQQLVGLKTAGLAPATLPAEMKAYGRVLDSPALVSLHDDVLSARAALWASQEQYLRVKQLAVENNASAQLLETAEAQLKRDQSAVETSAARLMGASSQAILSQPASFFQDIADQKTLLIRLDTPAGDWPARSPTAALLLLPGISRPVGADFLGRAAAVDPQVQGAGFIFEVTNAPPPLTPGLAIAGFLQLPGGAAAGFILPDSAVVRSDGADWIYVQANETNFQRDQVFLDHPAKDGWFVTNIFAPNDKIVVVGAQVLLSEEHKAQIQIGD
ncbi:MAG TPA: hypothetical protein VGV18_05475 [Verrucomicrobiae bacterium]|nr:hypothetical protein [Verrucomicrobiae bacterium]